MIARSSETIRGSCAANKTVFPSDTRGLQISTRFPVDAADVAIGRGPIEAK